MLRYNGASGTNAIGGDCTHSGSTLLSLLISHPGPASEINEKREAMLVRFRERIVPLVVALLQTLAAIAVSVTAAAVLG
jgi:hypothetical protein